MTDPWDTLCACGHPMRQHILDWDVDPEIDCRFPGCTCPEFTMPPAPRPEGLVREDREAGETLRAMRDDERY